MRQDAKRMQKQEERRLKESIGENICEYRQNLKMTQEEFACCLGVTPQAVSRWERGGGLPDLSLLKGICQILHISSDTLLGISDTNMTENHNAQMEQEIRRNLFCEPLVVEFGSALIPSVEAGLKTECDPKRNAPACDYVNRKRKELASKHGILMPILRLRDNIDLEDNAYRILSYDQILYEGHTKPDSGERNLTDAYFEMIDRTALECLEHYAGILNKQLVKVMIDNLKDACPGVVDGLVPEKISYLRLMDHLRDRLEQGKSIRDLIHILEDMEREL